MVIEMQMLFLASVFNNRVFHINWEEMEQAGQIRLGGEVDRFSGGDETKDRFLT